MRADHLAHIALRESYMQQSIRQRLQALGFGAALADKGIRELVLAQKAALGVVDAYRTRLGRASPPARQGFDAPRSVRKDAMKILLFLLGLGAGFWLGFALAAWALYETVSVGPAKYAFTRSAGPVPPYVLDGTQKRFRIECISESVKDCPQPHSIPAPGTAGLLLAGLAVLIRSRA